MRNKGRGGHALDITSVIDREEITAAFGAATMWRATIAKLTARLAQTTDPHKQQHLRLLILNAEVQLSLHDEQ